MGKVAKYKYRLTSRQRMSILKAQKISAQKRRSNSRWARRGAIPRFLVMKSANVLSGGASGAIHGYFIDRKKAYRKKQRAKKRGH